MKEKELRERAECCLCGRKIGQTSRPIFNVVTVERYMLDGAAIHRKTGLEMLLGNNAMLASMMGPDEDMAVALSKHTATVCEDCALAGDMIPQIRESV